MSDSLTSSKAVDQEAHLARWIDLNDPSGAKLKLATIDVGGAPVRHLFVTNLAWSNPKWRRCVEEMGFVEAPNRRYLVRRIAEGGRISLRQYSQIFTQARVREMMPSEYILGYGKTAASQVDTRQARIDLQGARRLGRNARGHVVYEGVSGRFAHDEDTGRRIDESSEQEDPDFLRLSAAARQYKPGSLELHEAIMPAATGIVLGMQRGEPMHTEHIHTLAEALFGRISSRQSYEVFEAAIFNAMHERLMHLTRAAHATPASAYLEASRIHAYQPVFVGQQSKKTLVPLPLALIAQQMLGDVRDRVIVLPNRWDGALALYLDGAKIRAWQTQPYAGPRSNSRLPSFVDAAQAQQGLDLESGQFSPLDCASADVLLLNVDIQIDEFGQRLDLRLASQSLRQLQRGSRAVLLLPADDIRHPGVLSQVSTDFLSELAQRYVIEDAWEVAPILLRKDGEGSGVRLIALRAEAPQSDQIDSQMKQISSGRLRVMSSWDAIKTHVDERMQSLNLAQPDREHKEQDEDEDLGAYQRPYLAFSRLGEARTMVPANLQAPLQQYMTALESRVGPVDDFVSRMIGMGPASLMKRFSPEQIDGVAIMLSRLLIGRSSILADDTGIGKGRQLAALAVWANKQGKNVIFITDRANLFSDLARDLNDIGEWGRFAPLVFNADGEITIDAGSDEPPRVLAKGEPHVALTRLLQDNVSMREAGRNICFLTYSQINTEESEKARWIKNQAKDALVIFDEAHICAWSDSNMALHASEIASAAAAVQFASATWAKSADNLHVYQRAFPLTVSTATLSETMHKGGETFSEIFSSMLALEGAIIRREHDLSRLEVELLVDERNRSRNEQVSDLVADALGSAAYLAGEMEQVFIRTNADSVRALRQAREARAAVLPSRVKLFSSSFGAGSVVYQVMKGVQGALNADHVARLAVESLRKGMKPVIVSDATGESLMEKLLMKNALDPTQQQGDQSEEYEGTRLVRMPTLRDLLRDILVSRLTTMRVRDVATEDLVDGGDDSQDGELVDEVAREGARQVDRSEGDEVVLDDALRAAGNPANTARARARDALRKAGWKEVSIFSASTMSDELRAVYEKGINEIESKITSIPEIPLNAMDVIEQTIRDAGYRIGEITGRKNQLIKMDGGEDVWRMSPRSNNKRSVKATIKAFNDGVFDAILINRSAAAGLSLHSSPRFADRSRRHLIEHMIPEDPVNRIQLLGRVNRYDQVSSPLITTASTGIYGEVRYLMMQNRKLAKMSANVRSSRDNAMSLRGVVDLFNSVGSKAVRSYMQDSPLVCKRLGFDPDVIESMPDVVNRITMRIPLLTVVQQKQVYEEIYSRFDEILLREEMRGVNPLKPAEMDVKAKEDSLSLFIGDDDPSIDDEAATFGSAFDSPVWVKRLYWHETLKPQDWRAVRAAAEASRQRLLDAQLVVIDEDDLRVSSDAEEFLALPDSEDDLADDMLTGNTYRHMERNRGGTIQYRTASDKPMPRLNAEIVSAMLAGFDGMKRLMLLQAKAGDSTNMEALANKSPAYRRALFVHEWMLKNLERLVPGASVSWIARNGDDINLLRPDYVITDVKIPAKEHWMHLGKWQITLVAGGDERGREFSLRSLLSEVDGLTFRGEITGRMQTTLFGPTLKNGIYGAEAVRLRDAFHMAPSGKRRRGASVLAGNLYLASEWAAATGKGRSIIYTNESGSRQRGILLPQDLEGVRSDFLPVRLADANSQRRFLQALMLPQAQDWLSETHRSRVQEEHFHVLDLSFKSAMVRMRSGNNLGNMASSLVLVPGVGIGISMQAADLRRVAGSLKAAQKATPYKVEDTEQNNNEDSDVRIVQHRSRKSSPAIFARAMPHTQAVQDDLTGHGTGARADKASKSGLIVIYAETPQQIDRALTLLSKSAGIEIYAAQSPYRQIAGEVIRMSIRERRREASEAQAALMGCLRGDQATGTQHDLQSDSDPNMGVRNDDLVPQDVGQEDDSDHGAHALATG